MHRFTAGDILIDNMLNNISVNDSFQLSETNSSDPNMRTSSPDMISAAADNFNFDSLGLQSASVDHTRYSNNLGQPASQIAFQSPALTRRTNYVNPSTFSCGGL
jgi:hypothetical protein